MSDVFDKQARSEIMRKVRSSGNKSTELKLIAVFRELGMKGWRRGYPVIGKPDFIFPKDRIAIFVDGCFWHGHDCRSTSPVANADYWTSKLDRNKRRDADVTALFEQRGWTVIRIWECELKKKNRVVLMEKLKQLCVLSHIRCLP